MLFHHVTDDERLREGWRRGWATPFLAIAIAMLVAGWWWPELAAVGMIALGVVYFAATTWAAKKRYEEETSRSAPPS